MSDFLVMGRWRGPVLTLIVVLATEGLSRVLGWSISLAPAFVALVFVAYEWGLRSSLAGAVVIVADAVWSLWPVDPVRAVIVSLCAVAVAVMVGLLKRRSRLSDSLNGNLAKAIDMVHLVRFLKNSWAELSDSARWQLILIMEDRAGNLAQSTKGWVDLAERKRIVQEEIDQIVN